MPKPSERVDNNEAQDEPKQPLSVRETIQMSLRELEDNPEDDNDKDPEKNDDTDIEDEDPASEGILEDKSKKKKEVEAASSEDEEVEDDNDDGETEEVEPEVKEVKAKKTQIEAPENWKGEADWDKTPASVRQRIIKREQEVSEGFKQYGQKAREFDKYEQIIGPRRQSMAKIGVSPEQVIGRALEWMDALAHPDQGTRVNSFKLLARNFGVDFGSLAGNEPTGESSRAGGNEQGDVSPQVREYISSLEQKIGGLEQRLGGLADTYTSQQDRAAMQYLQSWSKDKPHFESVQKEMVALINSGIVPPAADGSLDLDTAYDMAINANPTVRQLVAAERAKEAKKEADTKAKKEREKKQASLSKARAAGGSLKPGAPSLSNGKTDARGLSVRDTIKLSMKQMNG